jgi:hypothetical protein
MYYYTKFHIPSCNGIFVTNVIDKLKGKLEYLRSCHVVILDSVNNYLSKSCIYSYFENLPPYAM